MKQTDFAKTLARYLTDFLPGQRNVSPNTIKSYSYTFKQYLMFMQENKRVKPERITFKSVTTSCIKEFLHWLETTKNVSTSTRNQRLAAIHSFFRYAQTENPEILFKSQKILGIPFKKRQKPTIPHLSKNQLAYLFEQPDTSTKRGRRDLALMVVLYDAGARVQELIDLKVCDVRLDQPAMITLTGKGNKKRNIPILDKTKNILKGYMNENHLFESGRHQSPLFHNSRHQAFTRPGITYILSKYYQQVRISHNDEIFPDYIHIC